MKRPKKVFYMIRESTGQKFKLSNTAQLMLYKLMGDKQISKQEFYDVQDKS